MKPKVSRQRLLQIRYKSKGRCIICGKPAFTGYRCQYHAEQALAQARKRSHASPWKPGSRGRPPLNHPGAPFTRLYTPSFRNPDTGQPWILGKLCSSFSEAMELGAGNPDFAGVARIDLPNPKHPKD